MNLSRDFQLWEFEYSDTARLAGKDNHATEAAVANLKTLCENVLQPLRDAVGEPIKIQSGYRSPWLNEAVNGAKTSQHLRGQAADIKIGERSGSQIANAIIQLVIGFDQIVIYPTFCHVSFNAAHNRRSIVDKTR